MQTTFYTAVSYSANAPCSHDIDHHDNDEDGDHEADDDSMIARLCGCCVTPHKHDKLLMLLASMQQREKEIAVLRIIGAGAGTIFRLILVEAMLLAGAASVTAVALVSGVFAVAKEWLASHYGMFISANLLTLHTALVVGAIMLATLICSLLPAIDAYRGAINQRL